MFLEKGLDPVQSVFDLHIPDSSALLDPSEKTKLAAREAFSPATEGHQSRWLFLLWQLSVLIAGTHV